MMQESEPKKQDYLNQLPASLRARLSEDELAKLAARVSEVANINDDNSTEGQEEPMTSVTTIEVD